MDTPRALIVSATADLALLMFDEAVHSGCIPDYMRIETPDGMKEALRSRPWDLLVGGWTEAWFAAHAAQVVLEESIEIRSLSIVNYRSATLLFVIPWHSLDVGQVSWLAASIDRLFRELSASAVGEAETTSIPSVSLGLWTSLAVRHSEAAEVASGLNNLLTVILGCAEVLVAKLANDRRGIQYMTELTAAAKSAELLAADLMLLSRTASLARNDCETTIVIIRRILTAMAGPGLVTTIRITSNSTFVPISRRELETLCAEIVTRIGERAAQSGGKLEILVADPAVPFEAESPLISGPSTQLNFVFTASESVPDAGTDSSRGIVSRKEAGDLGLSVAYRILESAGGRLVIRQWATGVAYIVVLPLVDLPPYTNSHRGRIGDFR